MLAAYYVRPVLDGVHDARPDAAARRLTDHEKCVDAVRDEVSDEHRAKERARRHLAKHPLPRRGVELVDDRVADLGKGSEGPGGRTCWLASPDVSIAPAVFTTSNPASACRLEQAMRRLDRLPGSQAARGGPLLDRLQQRQATITVDGAVAVDDGRRPRSDPAKGTRGGRC